MLHCFSYIYCVSCSTNSIFTFPKYNRMSFENDSTPTEKKACQSLKCMKRRVRFVRSWRIGPLKMCMRRWNPFLKTNDVLLEIHSVRLITMVAFIPTFCYHQIKERTHVPVFAVFPVSTFSVSILLSAKQCYKSTAAFSGSKFIIRHPPKRTSGISSSCLASIVKPILKIKSWKYGISECKPFLAKNAQ